MLCVHVCVSMCVHTCGKTAHDLIRLPSAEM